MKQVVSWSPWSDFERVLNAIERENPARQPETSGIFVPVDIYEQEGRILVRCSVPGVKPDDLKLTIDHGMLTLSGEMQNEYERTEGTRVYHREHAYGRFTRSVKLPEDIDEGGVDASFEHGVLTISVARKVQPQRQPKQIAIRTAATPESKQLQSDNRRTNGRKVEEPEKTGAMN